MMLAVPVAVAKMAERLPSHSGLRETMSITTNPQGTFTIEYEYRDDDSPLELYRVEYWTVSSVLLDRVIHNFSSTQVQRAHEEHYGEITNVVFSVDGLSLGNRATFPFRSPSTSLMKKTS